MRCCWLCGGGGGQSVGPAHTAGFPTPGQLPCSPLSPPPAPPLTAANFRTYRRGRRAGLQLSRSRRSVGLGLMLIHHVFHSAIPLLCDLGQVT